MAINPHSLRAERHDLVTQAEARIAAAKTSGKDFTALDQSQHNSAIARIKEIDAWLEKYEAQFPRQEFRLVVPGSDSPEARAHVDLPRFFAELGDFMRGQITAATDTPVYIGTGAGVESVGATVPTEVLSQLTAYFNLDSFALAGARQLLTDNTAPLVQPVVSGGAAAATYNEGSAPTQSQPFALDSFTFGGTKYSRLVKASDESLMNSALPLQNVILDELAAGVATTFTAAITTAMLAAFTGNASVLVPEGTNDCYHTLLSVMHAVPPRFALPANKWMASRATLSKIKDARTVSSGVPFFNPELNQIFGKDLVINDNLSSGQVVFGDWSSGAFVRKSPFSLLVLRERYSENGLVGFRATQWLDSHFLAELSSVTTQPLHYTVLS